MKSWLEKNDVEKYSTHKEGKSVIAERFIIILKSKIYKYITSISKNIYIDKLDYIVNKYNNTYHKTLKMKPVDVKWRLYIDSSQEINDKDPKFKIEDIVRISEYKNIFAKGYVPNWSEEVFIIKKAKNTVSWTYAISNFKGEKFVGMIYEKEFQKANQKNLRVEKLIKRKGDKLYIKWKGYGSFLTAGFERKT